MKKLVELFKKLNYIFDREQKIKIVFLMILILLTTFMELLGVAAIMPFVNVVMSPDTIERTWYLKWLYEKFHFTNVNSFIALLGIALIVIYVAKNLAVSVMYYLQYYFTFSNQRKLAGKVLDNYLHQPYLFHLRYNSAELIRNVDTDVEQMFQGIIAILQLISETCVCVVLGVYLLIQDKSIAIGVVLLLTVFLLLFAKKFKRYLSRIGDEDRYYKAEIYKWLHQSFGGMKETKVLGRENYFSEKFNTNYANWAEREKKYRFLQVAPRPVMETVCITAVMLIIVLKLLNGTNSSYFITTIAVFAVAAFRLLPSINRITNYMSVIMFNLPRIDAVYSELQRLENIAKSCENRNEQTDSDSFSFEKDIMVNNVSFKYPEKNDYVLKNITLKINRNQSVAFIGPSGAGKTTLADIILGVLEPEEGQVLVDGKNITDNYSNWQQKIGYIPQNIYLLDDTIRNNILYGIDGNEENQEKLWNALEGAQLKEFVLGLKDGLDTVIGENGVCISGGQRQRIGIARALYNDPEVLVLDEATSALDNDTESAVMEAINLLSGKKTLIIIAHRLSTIQRCEVIFEVNEKNVTVKKID